MAPLGDPLLASLGPADVILTRRELEDAPVQAAGLVEELEVLAGLGKRQVGGGILGASPTARAAPEVR